jgi:hypothetical protein
MSKPDELICMKLLKMPFGDLQITNRMLIDDVDQAIENTDTDGYNESYECESHIELQPKDAQKIHEYLVKEKIYEEIEIDCISKDEAEDRLFDFIEDRVFELTTKKEYLPQWVDNTLERLAEEDRALDRKCQSCSHEDCACCSSRH